MTMIRLMVVDDDTTFRTTFCELMGSVVYNRTEQNGQHSIEVIQDVGSGQKALEYLEQSEVKPDVILMDIRLGEAQQPSGLDTTKRITARYPTIKVLIFSLWAEIGYVKQAFRNGASGYFVKGGEEGFPGLVSAIVDVWNKGYYLSPRIQERMIEIVKVTGDRSDPFGLTDRQLQVAKLYARGMPDKEIASKLEIAPGTVDTHKTEVRKKLKAESPKEVKARLVEAGLLSSDVTE